MLIAHLPAGYLLARRIAPRLAPPGALRRMMALGLAGSIFPDLDMVYFHAFDGRQTLHHDYWTHIPAFWLGAALGAALLMWLARAAIPWREGLVFLAGIFLHLILDTPTGGILWGWPVSQQPFLLFEITARFDWWVWNFVLHWTFLFELVLCAWSVREFRVIDRFRDLKRALRQRMVAWKRERTE